MKRLAVLVSLLCLLAVGWVLAAPRSGKWRSLQAAWLKANPYCAACGTTENLNVHHVKPFHMDPSRELDWTNLITLCREHHFTVGHDPDGPDGPDKADWRKENLNVREDAERMRWKPADALSPENAK